MKKALCVVLAAFVAASFANDARVASLGGVQFFYLDESHAIQNPALLPTFANRAVLELGTYSEMGLVGQSGYGFVSLGESFSLGAALLRHNDNFDEIISHYLPATLQRPQNDFDLLLSLSLGDLALGLGTHFAGWSYKTTSGDDETTRKTRAMAFTLGGAYTSGDFLGEANFQLRLNSYKDEDVLGSATSSEESEGGTGLSLNMRAFAPMGDAKLVPSLGFSMFSYTPKTVSGSTTTEGNKYSSMGFFLRCGLNIPVLEEGWVAPGLGVAYVSTKDEGESTTTTQTLTYLPELYLGAEIPVKDWLVARAAYRRAFGSFKTKTSNGTETTETQTLADVGLQPDQISIGVGLKLADGAVSIDGFVGENFIHEGGYVVSGIADNLFTMVSTTFSF